MLLVICYSILAFNVWETKAKGGNENVIGISPCVSETATKVQWAWDVVAAEYLILKILFRLQEMCYQV